MGVVKLTQAIIDAAKRAGACTIRYKAGTPLADVEFSELTWAEDNIPEEAAVLAKAAAHAAGSRGVLPLSAWSGYGSGSGSGYGYGDWDGSGSGSGSGYGSGYGDGSGYGSGSGSGYGSGSGDGSRDVVARSEVDRD